MPQLYRTTPEEWYVVHRLEGDKEAIEYLKRINSPAFVEALLYHAKRYGQSEFYLRDKPYRIKWLKKTSFLIEPVDLESAETTWL